MTCSVSACEGTVWARGWCSKHYQRWRVHGDPEGGLCRCDDPIASHSTKECRSCGATKARTDFTPDPSMHDGMLSHCKQCRSAREAGRRHGISPEEVLELWGRACDICGDSPTHIDHDHSCCSGRQSCGLCVRGSLCNTCNTVLGRFGDDPIRLRLAAAYLEAA